MGVGVNAQGAAADGTVITIKNGEKISTLNVDSTTTVQDFLNSCNSAGLNAVFDEKQQRFFISSLSSGSGNEFSITSGIMDSDQKSAYEGVKTAVGYDSLTSGQKTTFANTLKTLQYADKTDSADKTEAITTAETALKTLSDDAAKKAATDYYQKQQEEYYKNIYFDNGGKMTEEGKQALLDSGMKEDTISNSTVSEVTEKLEKLATKNATADLKTQEYVDKISDAVKNGLKDKVTNDVIVKSETDRYTGIKTAVNKFAEEFNGDIIGASADALAGLGITEITGAAVAQGDTSTGMVVIAASDTVIEYNGAELTSDSTSITIAGLTLNIMDTTAADETISITVSNDTQSAYDSIKDFLAEYNSLLSGMNEAYNAASSSGYDVLTDDEKAAMTDDEVEKWESKIKDSLLRKDSTLNSLIFMLKDGMSATYTASNGKTYSLASLGITTSSDYAEGGLLHIKGDEDDTEYAESENKLKSMLDSDPDIVKEVLSGIFGNLYDKMQKKMQSTTMSSALTFYNDKEMSSQLSDYKDEIADMEDRLADMEERYYKQFTAMEKAMANLNSQSSYFSGLMGQ